MKNKIYANKGVKRNKKPLRNIVYQISVKDKLKDDTNLENYEKFKHKDEGYLILEWCYEGDSINNWYGFITPDAFKELIGSKQWSKFCQGKRIFINQRRVNGNNI